MNPYESLYHRLRRYRRDQLQYYYHRLPRYQRGQFQYFRCVKRANRATRELIANIRLEEARP